MEPEWPRPGVPPSCADGHAGSNPPLYPQNSSRASNSIMRVRLGILVFAFFPLSALLAASPAECDSPPQETPLVVPAGVPLRLYLTRRAPKRTGAAVEAKVLDPVYAFDRQ